MNFLVEEMTATNNVQHSADVLVIDELANLPNLCIICGATTQKRVWLQLDRKRPFIRLFATIVSHAVPGLILGELLGSELLERKSTILRLPLCSKHAIGNSTSLITAKRIGPRQVRITGACATFAEALKESSNRQWSDLVAQMNEAKRNT